MRRSILYFFEAVRKGLKALKTTNCTHMTLIKPPFYALIINYLNCFNYFCLELFWPKKLYEKSERRMIAHKLLYDFEMEIS